VKLDSGSWTLVRQVHALTWGNTIYFIVFIHTAVATLFSTIVTINTVIRLRRITRSLADALISNGVDLVVIEGMGRVIHTNLNAKFNCDVLKVLKRCAV